MKYLLFFTFLSAGHFFAVPPAATTTTLEVRITGVEKIKGTMEVTLFNSRRKWLKKGKAFAVKRVAVDGKDVVVIFEDLPYGEYALVSYQDLNKNEKIDKNILGLPKEPYAMTRKAKSRFRKPYFKEMKFSCSEKHQIIETELHRL